MFSSVRLFKFFISSSDVFQNVTVDTPDVVNADENSKVVSILEVGCIFKRRLWQGTAQYSPDTFKVSLLSPSL